MSSRRPRGSSGLVPSSDSNEAAMLSTVAQFDDFRKRHSRQNREVVMDNISRRTMSINLQKEVTELRKELLEVQRSNSILRRQIKQVQAEAFRVRTDAVRDALDGILTAVPVLRTLRNALEPVVEPPRPGTNAPVMRDKTNPTATRPAASAAADMFGYGGLGTLCEAPDEGSPGGGRRRAAKGRRTPVKRVTPSPKRRPIMSFTSGNHKRWVDVESPVTSPASPSPKRTPKRTVRRRRESGMLNPSQFEDSEEPAQPAQLEHSGDASVWEEGEHIQMEPADAEALLEEAVVEEAVTPQPKKGKGRTTPLAGPKVKDIAAQLQAAADGATEKPKSRKRVTKAAEPAEETSNPTSASRNTAETASPTNTAPSSPGPEGGRQRRARQTINYKEPSLGTKMRKPDGPNILEQASARVRESLGSAPSVASSGISGVRRKSALPRSAAKIGLGAAASSSPDEDEYEELDRAPTPSIPRPKVRLRSTSPLSDAPEPEQEGEMEATVVIGADKEVAAQRAILAPRRQTGDVRLSESVTAPTPAMPKRAGERRTARRSAAV